MRIDVADVVPVEVVEVGVEGELRERVVLGAGVLADEAPIAFRGERLGRCPEVTARGGAGFDDRVLDVAAAHVHGLGAVVHEDRGGLAVRLRAARDVRVVPWCRGVFITRVVAPG